MEKQYFESFDNKKIPYLFFKIWKISINCGIIISNDIEETVIKNTNIEKYY